MSVQGSTLSLDVRFAKTPDDSDKNRGALKSSDASGLSPKSRNLLTTCLYLSFFGLGLANSLLGPTLVHMTYLLDTDIKTLALSYTCGHTAYLIGSLLCGFIFDHLNSELQFAVATFGTGVVSAFCPWSPNIYIFIAAIAAQSFFMAYIDASGQSYLITLWTGHRLKEPMMQGAHGIWSVGATICPFIILPFLSELPDEISKNETGSNWTDTSSEERTGKPDVETVRYSYGVVGLLIVALAMCFFVGFCQLGPSFWKKAGSVSEEPSDKQTNRGIKRQSYIAMLALLFFFYAAYAWYEMIPGGLLSAFVLKGLEWDVENGPLVTSVYWGCHGFGRLLAIPVSMFISPGKMLTGSVTSTTAAFCLMLLVPVTHDIILWISVALAGLSMSSTFASMVLWTSDYLAITGVVASVLTVGGSAGGMTGAALAGYLFEKSSHMWVVYLSVIAGVVDIVIYIMMNILVKCCYRKPGDLYSAPKVTGEDANETELQSMTNSH